MDQQDRFHLAELMNSLVCAAQLRGEYKAKGQRELEIEWADRVISIEQEIARRFDVRLALFRG